MGALVIYQKDLRKGQVRLWDARGHMKEADV